MSRPLPKSLQVCTLTRTGVFVLEDASSVRTNLGKHSLFVCMVKSPQYRDGHKTHYPIRRITFCCGQVVHYKCTKMLLLQMESNVFFIQCAKCVTLFQDDLIKRLCIRLMHKQKVTNLGSLKLQISKGGVRRGLQLAMTQTIKFHYYKGVGVLTGQRHISSKN